MIDRQVIGPYDMEQDLGLLGGNIFHGGAQRWISCSTCGPAPGLRRLPHADHRACTTARARTHGGGGVNGIPGLAGLQHGEEGQGRRPQMIR